MLNIKSRTSAKLFEFFSSDKEFSRIPASPRSYWHDIEPIIHTTIAAVNFRANPALLSNQYYNPSSRSLILISINLYSRTQP